MAPPSRPMPPPPAIGSARPPKGTPEPTGTGGDSAGSEREATGERGGGPLDDNATSRWAALNVEIAEDDGPSDEAGSLSLPVAAMRSHAKSGPLMSAATSASALKLPELEASSSMSNLRAPSLGPPTAAGAGDSAGSWPRTDGWDLDDDAADTALNGGTDGPSSVPSVPMLPRPAASTVPSVPRPASSSIPSVPRPASSTIPSVPRPASSSLPSVPRPAPKELGSVPSIPRPAGGSVPSVPRPGGSRPKPAARESGNGSKVAPMPRLGAPRSTPAPRLGGASESSQDSHRPLFSEALSPDGSLLASPSGDASGSPLDAWPSFDTGPDAAAIDASAPPSSGSPLDALPSFEPSPMYDGVPEDGVPSMDSSALLGVALEAEEYEPGPPLQVSGLGPFGDSDDGSDPLPSVPRLPVPGMLRDGLAPAADFRAAPRAPRNPFPGAMQPPRGMVPPKLRDDEQPRLKPGDTASFVALATEELLEEDERRKAVQAAAVAAAEPHREPWPPVAASAASASGAAQPAWKPSATAAGPAPGAYAYPAEVAAEPRRRGGLVALGAIALVAVLGLVGWFLWKRSEERSPQTTTAAAAVEPPPAPAAEDGAVVEPEPPAPLPMPVAVEAEVAASTSGAAEPEPVIDASTGEPDAEASGDDAGTTAAVEAVEAVEDAALVEEAAGEPASSSRKGSGKSKSSGKPKTTDTGKSEPPPPTPAKPDSAPSAAKLLKQARAAYQAGNGASAYALASKSNRMEPTGAAAEVMALAACQMKDAGKAKSALKIVPLFSRTGVRSTCKSKHGMKLGL